jgi:hypothetical protein
MVARVGCRPRRGRWGDGSNNSRWLRHLSGPLGSHQLGEAGEALAEMRMGGELLGKPEPESGFGMGLKDELVDVDLTEQLLASSEEQESGAGTLLATQRGPDAVAGVFAGAGIGIAQEGDEHGGHYGQPFAQMVSLDVAQLVGNDEINGLLIALIGLFQYVGEQHDEICAHEPVAKALSAPPCCKR